ncbi:hypothetical protein K1T71_010190 [Dendrolimus kikuchii]|uniref:Uncharacterized protein n=1 Tax=Dendrolimus kikuchii TaxID=765133 RepID=A0ACC1CQV7_9NEOP|nr:hypothetical protein K1T71_010190 [Dendrolimus kikuchii]
MEYPQICPLRYFTDHCLTPHEHDLIVPATSNYYRPWNWYAQAAIKDFGSNIERRKDKFKISLDVQHFRPEEISVKVSDKEIIIEGMHEERQDEHGFVSRQFKRRYVLPKDFSSDNVVSSLSSDGVLTVIAEKKTIMGTEKIVPINFCGTRTRKVFKESRKTTGVTQKYIDDTIREANELIIKNKAHNLVRNEHSRLLKPEFMGEIGQSNEQIEAESLKDKPSTSTDKNLKSATTLSKLEAAAEKEDIDVFDSADLSASTTSSFERQSMKSESQSIQQESSSSYQASVSSTMKKSGQMSDLNDAISAELREAADNI